MEVSWLERIWCAMRGHDYTMTFDDPGPTCSVHLKCCTCNHESAGWEWTRR